MRSARATSTCHSSRRSPTRTSTCSWSRRRRSGWRGHRRSGHAVATWLNVADDHQDVHTSTGGYQEAKARIWRNLVGGRPRGGERRRRDRDEPCRRDAATADVRARARGSRRLARRRTAGCADRTVSIWSQPRSSAARFRTTSPTRLPPRRPHSGAARRPQRCREALRAFRGLPHRVELVGEAGGVRFYDDSKATAPHATLAAVAGFASAVLIAGGRNKGLDLSTLLDGGAPPARGGGHRRGGGGGGERIRRAPSGRDRRVDGRGGGRRTAPRRAGRCDRPVTGVRLVRLVHVVRASAATTSNGPSVHSSGQRSTSPTS